MIALLKSDFEHIGQVAKHCDQRKLDIAIQEAIVFDLRPIFCDFFYDLQNNWGSVEKIWTSLIEGGEYINCKENTINILGVKKALTYLAYSRYVIINSFDDTPNGQVTKTNQFSIPKPLAEIQSYATKYKNMGLTLIDDAKGYICNNSDSGEFDNYDFTTCVDCGCSECKGTTQSRSFGLRGTNIEKKI